MSDTNQVQQQVQAPSLGQMTPSQVKEANDRKLNVLFTVLIFLAVIVGVYYFFGVVGSMISLVFFAGSLLRGS